MKRWLNKIYQSIWPGSVEDEILKGSENFISPQKEMLGVDKPIYFNSITRSFGTWPLTKRSIVGSLTEF